MWIVSDNRLDCGEPVSGVEQKRGFFIAGELPDSFIGCESRRPLTRTINLVVTYVVRDDEVVLGSKLSSNYAFEIAIDFAFSPIAR
jgi:hypothetical protein